MAKHTTIRLWFAFSLLLANLCLLLYLGLRSDGLSHIYFFDVGQGDASLVYTSDNKVILIDGGPTSDIVDKLAQVLPPWEKEIDLMILSHAHADHVTGLLSVLEQYQVQEFWYNGSQYDTVVYNQLLGEVQARGIPTKVVVAPYTSTIGAANISVIHPLTTEQAPSDPNEASVVNVVNVGAVRLMFTGDASVENEATMLNYGSIPDIDILKVPHQGSHTSSSPEFLTTADPEVGVIMVGANNYGHPHTDVLSRYRDLGVKIYRTDQSGTIEVVTDGQRYLVKD